LICDICEEIIKDVEKRQAEFTHKTEDNFELVITPPKDADLCPACERIGYAKAAKLAWDKNKQSRKIKEETK